MCDGWTNDVAGWKADLSSTSRWTRTQPVVMSQEADFQNGLTLTPDGVISNL